MKCERCGNEMLQDEKACKVCGYTAEASQPDGENPAEIPQPTKKAKKKHGCLITLLSVLGVVVVALLCIAIFLPGFFKPKGLGVKTSKEAYESALNKLNHTKATVPSTEAREDDTNTYAELVDVDASLTSEEVTSLFNYDRKKYYMVKKAQIRVNPDDTVEFSGAVDTDYFLDEFLDGEYSREELTETFPMIKAIPDSVNLYIKLSGEIEDNRTVDFALNSIEVQGISLPASLYDTDLAQEEISSILDDFLARKAEKSNSTYTTLKAEGGELQIVGLLKAFQGSEEND